MRIIFKTVELSLKQLTNYKMSKINIYLTNFISFKNITIYLFKKVNKISNEHILIIIGQCSFKLDRLRYRHTIKVPLVDKFKG